MKLFKTRTGIVVHHQENFFLIEGDWDRIVNRSQLHQTLLDELVSPRADLISKIEKELVPPIGSQEVWAAGVTYFRSKEARMEESRIPGGGSFYDQVYAAERPELFFKAIAQRVAGHGQTVNIRRDSTWNVPEPELTLFISSDGSIQGYTVGNDMSSRSIEGENPLYLPQAKSYERSAALGPCLYVPGDPIPPETTISMEILRNGKVMYSDSVQINRMKRKHAELASFLFRECEFPVGCYLMTGTCLVPPNEFTLHVSDQVNISIEHIGTLSNSVAVKS